MPGMMIESMAGKSACMHGLVHDATPFTFSEENSAIDYFGKMLTEGMLVLQFSFWNPRKYPLFKCRTDRFKNILYHTASKNGSV